MVQGLSLHSTCQDEPHEKPHRCWHFQLAQWFKIWLGDPGSDRHGHSQLAAHRANQLGCLFGGIGVMLSLIFSCRGQNHLICFKQSEWVSQNSAPCSTLSLVAFKLVQTMDSMFRHVGWASLDHLQVTGHSFRHRLGWLARSLKLGHFPIDKCHCMQWFWRFLTRLSLKPGVSSIKYNMMQMNLNLSDVSRFASSAQVALFSSLTFASAWDASISVKQSQWEFVGTCCLQATHTSCALWNKH